MAQRRARGGARAKQARDARGQMLLFAKVPFAFGPGFLHDHAGHVMSEARQRLRCRREKSRNKLAGGGSGPFRDS